MSSLVDSLWAMEWAWGGVTPLGMSIKMDGYVQTRESGERLNKRGRGTHRASSVENWQSTRWLRLNF